MSQEQQEQQDEVDDWVLVPNDWWKLSFYRLSWTYRTQLRWSQSGVLSALHPRPPYYHDQLYWRKWEHEIASDEDTRLNASLVGVQNAEEAVFRYELDVGIDQTHFVSEEHPALSGYEADLERTWQLEWEKELQGLFGTSLQPRPPQSPSPGRLWDLDSDSATESLPPSTPPSDTDRKSYAAVLFDDQRVTGTTVVAPAPAKALNAAALSFIPAQPHPSEDDVASTGTSPTYEFHFPSLNATVRARSLPPHLEKDEQGFYQPVPPSRSHASTRTVTPRRPSASLLPSFLADTSVSARTRHSSKTREIVDRLRSAGVASRTLRRTSISPPGEEEDEVESKNPSSPGADMLAEDASATSLDGWITHFASLSDPAPVECPVPGSSKDNEGWIEGTSLHPRPTSARQRSRPRTHSQGHKRSASGGSIASLSLTPTTPSSASSSLRTLPSPTSSITSLGAGPGASTTTSSCRPRPLSPPPAHPLPPPPPNTATTAYFPHIPPPTALPNARTQQPMIPAPIPPLAVPPTYYAYPAPAHVPPGAAAYPTYHAQVQMQNAYMQMHLHMQWHAQMQAMMGASYPPAYMPPPVHPPVHAHSHSRTHSHSTGSVPVSGRSAVGTMGMYEVKTKVGAGGVRHG